MSDTIFVNGLVLHAYHGVMPHEGKVGQPFTLDLALAASAVLLLLATARAVRHTTSTAKPVTA